MMAIYEIVNLADGKMTSYVGSSVDIRKRWRNHVSALRRGDHENPHLQAAWDKYGEGAFSFCVLEQVVNEGKLLGREQHFLGRAIEVGDTYNIAQDAKAPMLGITHSEERCRKISAAQMGRKRKPFSAEHRRNLSEAKKGRQRRPLPQEYWQKLGEAHAKPYPAFVHRETGEIIPAGRNLAKLCRKRGLAKSAMWCVAHGQHKSHKGWVLADIERSNDGSACRHSDARLEPPRPDPAGCAEHT